MGCFFLKSLICFSGYPRWEKYQSEEEAALGRGKRLRKAVSYREAYTPHPSETLSEVLLLHRIIVSLFPKLINVFYIADHYVNRMVVFKVLQIGLFLIVFNFKEY